MHQLQMGAQRFQTALHYLDSQIPVRGNSGGQLQEILSRLGTTAAGSEESIQAFTDFCTLLDEEVPYIILGDFGTVCWYSSDMIPDRQGVDMYWWNSYFTSAA